MPQKKIIITRISDICLSKMIWSSPAHNQVTDPSRDFNSNRQDSSPRASVSEHPARGSQIQCTSQDTDHSQRPQIGAKDFDGMVLYMSSSSVELCLFTRCSSPAPLVLQCDAPSPWLDRHLKACTSFPSQNHNNYLKYINLAKVS